MDPARARRLRDQYRAIRQSRERAVEEGEKSLECEPGAALADARRKPADRRTGDARPDTLSYTIRWLINHHPYRALGYAATHTLYEVLACVKADVDDRYIGRRKLAQRREIHLGSIKAHVRKLTTPWRMPNGLWQPPLFRHAWAPGRTRMLWIPLLAGWAAFFRALNGSATTR